MKARLIGSKAPFEEITHVTLSGNLNWDVEQLEFERDRWQEPCKLNPEKDLSNPIDHWQDVRERAAIAAMQGLLARGWDGSEYVAKRSITIADALVEKLKGE